MTDSRGLGCTDERRCEMALDELDELIEFRLLLQTQRRANAARLVEGVLVEGLGGGNAVATLEDLALSAGKVGISSRYFTDLPPRDGYPFLHCTPWPPGCHPHPIGSRGHGV